MAQRRLAVNHNSMTNPSWRRSRRLGAWLLCWLALLPLHAAALDPEQPVGSLQIQRWYSDEGLPHNTVHALAQSRDGYLWLATWEGVARYNGRQFAHFDQGNLPGLSDAGFRAVLADDRGSVWAASVHGGLYRREGQSWRAYGKTEGLVSPNLSSLAGDGQGGVWIGSRDGGAMHLDAEGKLRAFGVADGLPDAWVLSFLVEPDGSVWIGTAHGLARFSGGGVAPAGTGLPDGGAVYTLARDRAGRLWAGTDSGLYFHDGRQFVAHRLHGLNARSVSALLEDRDGNLWVGSQSEGLWRVGTRGVERLTAAQGLSNNRVTALLEDGEGSLWVATNAGLNRLSDSAFRTYTRYDGLRDDFVRSVAEGRSGMWIGTSQGLHLLTATGIELVGQNQLSSDSVMSVLESGDGRLWVGTYDGGLNVRLANGQWALLDRAAGLPSNQIRALFEARDGQVWVGTAQGAARIAPTWQPGRTADILRLGTADGLPNSYVLSIHQTRDGHILLGTTNGFAQWTPNAAVRAWPGRAELAAGEVFAFFEDDDGSLLLGTDSGLVRWAEQRFETLSHSRGLADDAVFAITPDARGHLFLSTNAGLVRIDRAAVGRGGALRPVVFSRADGLAGTQINGSSQPSTTRSRDGHIWLPTARGVSELDLSRDNKTGRESIPVVIESLRIDGESVFAKTDAGIDVPAGKRRVQLEFAGLSFLRPDRVRYRYRLIGFDPEWSAPSAQSSVDFTNLPPGQYRFEVQAGYEDFEGSPIAVQQLRILPRFWQTVWFLPLVGGLLIGLVLILHRFRLLALQRRGSHLEALVEERTAELTLRNEALERADKDKSALLNTIQLQAQAFARQAREDGLTGLPNRRHFDQLFAAEFARHRIEGRTPVAGLADLDHFKSINDEFSHQAGDDTLRAVAAILDRHMQGLGVVARYGGEEFALFFHEADMERARAVTEAIRAEVAALRFTAWPHLRPTLSIGLSDSELALNHEKLLADADRQLYGAKGGGRNQVRG